MILMMVKVGDKDNDDDHDARNKDKSWDDVYYYR